MYSIYKLKNGKILSILTFDFFKSMLLDNGKHLVKSLEGREIDINGKIVSDLFYVNLLKDSKGFYFMYGKQKVYIYDYVHLPIKELISKMNHGNASIDEFVTTLKKDGENIIILEKLPEISENELNEISPYMKVIPCELIEDKGDAVGNYVVETIPINDDDKKIYGIAKYYLSDLYSLIKNGYFEMLEKKEYLKSLDIGKKRVLKNNFLR